MGKATISGGTRWKAYLERLAKKAEVRAGVMEDATTDEGERVAEYAAYNEFGTSRVPPRPFMRKTLERERENWIRGVGALLNLFSPTPKCGWLDSWRGRAAQERPVAGRGAGKDRKAHGREYRGHHHEQHGPGQRAFHNPPQEPCGSGTRRNAG